MSHGYVRNAMYQARGLRLLKSTLCTTRVSLFGRMLEMNTIIVYVFIYNGSERIAYELLLIIHYNMLCRVISNLHAILPYKSMIFL